MKYIIVGLHSSGKQKVADILSSWGDRCGKIFSNLPKPSDMIYNSTNYESFESKDVYDIFENNAYIFLQEIYTNSLYFHVDKYYEGLSKYSFDNNDIFILSPDQLLNIPPNVIKEDICFVWLDNTEQNRLNRYIDEDRKYNFAERDEYEKKDIGAFMKYMYTFNKSAVIYFNNEEPSRIAAIIHSLLIHPDLYDIFIKNFN